MPRSGQELHRTCAQSRDSMPDVCLDTRNVFLLHRRAPGVRFTTSSSSSTSFQYNLLAAARNSTCQVGIPHCCRDRAIVVSSSAASLRGIPQCDGQGINSAG
ncbi:hypothetical protein TcCL_ESM09117 [Trypanosoma cruzi]|nr:hypothetical protein TcCL_ESM09117 [Trypanosoma cruzi]